MKKFFLIFISVLTISFFIKFQYIRVKSSEITYVVQHELTTGIFNSYKLYEVDSFNLVFSDEKIAIIRIDGIKMKSPHNRAYYDLLVERSNNGLWKVKKIYTTKEIPVEKK